MAAYILDLVRLIVRAVVEKIGPFHWSSSDGIRRVLSSRLARNVSNDSIVVLNYGSDPKVQKLGSIQVLSDYHQHPDPIQEFISHDDVASDLSPSIFAVEDVQRIAILDIR